MRENREKKPGGRTTRRKKPAARQAAAGGCAAKDPRDGSDATVQGPADRPRGRRCRRPEAKDTHGRASSSLAGLPASLVCEIVEYLQGNIADVARLQMVCRGLQTSYLSIQQQEQFRLPSRLVLDPTNMTFTVNASGASYGKREGVSHEVVSQEPWLRISQDVAAREREPCFALAKPIESAELSVPPRFGEGATQVVWRNKVRDEKDRPRFCLKLSRKDGGNPVELCAEICGRYGDHGSNDGIKPNFDPESDEFIALVPGCSYYTAGVTSTIWLQVRRKPSHRNWVVLRAVFDWETNSVQVFLGNRRVWNTTLGGVEPGCFCGVHSIVLERKEIYSHVCIC